jgi:YVTN family beta-propeller protein
VNPVTNRVYTADSQSGTLTAIDAANDQSVTIGLGSNPLAVGTNPVTNQIYVCNADDNTVSVIDGVTGQSTTISVGTKPSALAVNPVSNQVYIVNTLGNSATIIDGFTNATTTVDVGMNPIAVAVDPVTNWVYVANSGNATVTAINGSTSQTMTLRVGGNPSAVAVNPSTDTIYVANRSDGTVTVIEGVTGRAATVNVGVNPSAIAVDSVTNRIYVANSGSNSVSVIDGATNKVTNVTVGLTPVAIDVNPLTNEIYVANSSSGTVTVIAGGTNQVQTLTVGSTPIAIAVNPVTDHIYITNAGSNTVTVIDGVSNQPTSIPTGTNPTALSINSITGQIYVTNSGSNSLSVISEQRVELLPLTTVVSPLPGNETVERSPTFVLSASSSYAPINPPIQGVRYQIDSYQGVWQAAAASGASFKATTSQLSMGPHVIYTFADNGQAGATTGLDENVAGGITGYFFAVVQGQTTTDVTSSSNPSSDAQPVTLTASVQAVAPATGIPTGTLSFFDGSTTLATGVALDGSGQATLTTSSLTPGTHSITSSYTGDVNFVTSTSGSLSQTVEREQTVATLNSSLNPSSDVQSITLTASVQAVAPALGIPTGTVSFLDGAAILATGVALNGSGNASFTTSSLIPGTHSLTVSYTGDTNFANSTSISLAQIVAQGQSVATLASSANPSVFGQGVSLIASVRAVGPATGVPTGAVTFFDGATMLASVVVLNGQASFTMSSLAPGTHVVTAKYGGDAIFAGSTSGINETVNSLQIALNLSKSSLTVQEGAVGNLSFSVSANGPMVSTITFDCKGLPANTNCQFSPSSLGPAALPGNVMVNISTNTVATGSSPRRGRGEYWYGLFVIGICLAGVERRSRRTRTVWGITTLLFLIVALGCGGGGGASTVSSNSVVTPTGVSSVKITASSGSLQTTASLTLTVVQ